MASSDRTTRLINIRDQLEKELENETLRRFNFTEAGLPPPATYSVDGRSVDWNGYLSTMLDKVAKIDEILALSDPFELPMRGTT